LEDWRVGWLFGSIVTGVLYDHSRIALSAFAVIVQLASVPVFAAAVRAQKSH
jgi:hypothetical protein